MGNAFLQKQAEDRRRHLNLGAHVGQQFMVDMLQLALHEEGFGYERMFKLLRRIEELSEYYKVCLAFSDESDARFVQMDEQLKHLCRDHMDEFVPFTDRYEGVRIPTMKTKFRAEPIGGTK